MYRKVSEKALKILIITNLYPPQELGGYGRAMADFCWGLKVRGNKSLVLTSNEWYLGDIGGEDASIDRSLYLKGSFIRGVQHIYDEAERRRIDASNRKTIQRAVSEFRPDGILIGNIDLLGEELVSYACEFHIPVLHHVGFIDPPYRASKKTKWENYTLVSASKAVRDSMHTAGLCSKDDPVVYPGARVEMFGEERKVSESTCPVGSIERPLCVSYAGLLMATKGLHVLSEALLILERRDFYCRMIVAGDVFQGSYIDEIRERHSASKVMDAICVAGYLSREELACFLLKSDVFVFPSIYPEAFGIVQVEAMASGIPVISSGTGGSAEVIENGETGLIFEPGNARSLAEAILFLGTRPLLREKMGRNARSRALEEFSVSKSAGDIERLFISRLQRT